MLSSGKSRVEIVIAARDKTQAAFAKVNTRMKTMGGASNKLSSSMGGLSSKMSSLATSINPIAIAAGAAALAFATMGGAAMKASLEFEKAFATIRVGTGATGESLAGLEESFKTVFTSVPTSTADAATAIADLNTRLGLTGEPLEELATQFLNLSRITGTDVSSAISSATRVMHDFAVSSEDQSTALDYLFKVSQSTGIGMTQLSSSMTQYGSVMRQMGFDINESAALLGKFEKEGVNLQLVLGSLRMGLANFAKAGEEPVEALQRVIEEIQGMGSVAGANLKAIEIFGSRAGPDMAAAIREGRFSIDELMATLDASTETINKAAADTLTFGDKWTLLKNKMTEAIVPIGDVITGVLGNAIEGLSGAFDILQKVAGPALDLILIKFHVLKAFLEGLAGPIIAALAPLKESFDALQKKFKEGAGKLSILSDIFTIITGAAKWLGEAIGTLVAMALTPLVAKLKEGIDLLAAFYDKLGPIKSALEWLEEGVHNVAESFRDTKAPIEEVETALENLENVGVEAPKAIAAAWALAIKSFQEGSGSYKEAIDGINEKIGELTEEWMTATDKRKAAIEKEVELLRSEGDALEELKKTAEDTLSGITDQTEKAIEKTKEFIVTIGDTKIEFKGAAAEVLKNADAYEKLEESARKLIDLDWSVFTEFEASLPRIDAGLGDMESSFVGFKGVLEDNIEELENIQEAIIKINEIGAPFIDKGFLKGVEAIGKFAGALKTASDAISDFSSLQDISIDGCINFSFHVHEMVRALEILESQMDDLVPAFGEMDSLIGSIIETFVWTSGKKEGIADEINKIAYAAKDGSVSIHDLWTILEETTKQPTTWFKGQFVMPYIKRYEEGVEDVVDITNDFLASEEVLERQMGYTTGALAFQTGQLNKITEALQPYLEFMRTLNELAALSTLSTEELNKGLNSIKDTLINLGTALSTFDLRSAMEALFDPEMGSALDFREVMGDYNTDFSIFITTLTRVTEVIQGLSIAMGNAAGMVVISSKEMERALVLIPAQLGEIAVFLGTDIWGDIVKGISAATFGWKEFENILEDAHFSKVITTISNLIGLMESMKDNFSETSEQVVISSKEMEAALSLIPAQLGEIAVFLGTDIWKDIIKGLSGVNLGYKLYAETVEDSMVSFNSAIDTFSSLISKILSLSEALKDMRDMTVLSVRDIDEALKNIPVFLDRFVDALALNMSAIKESLKDLDKEWSLHAEEMKATMPAYEDATDKIGKLISQLLSLNSALKQLAEMGTISGAEFDKGFASLMESISNFAVSLSKNVDGLIESLVHLDRVWIANQDTLVPLMRDFMIITTNFYEIANNANAMTDAFRDLHTNSGTLEKGFKSLIDFINQVVKSTKEFYTTEAAAELALFITDVDKVITAFIDLEAKLKGAMEKIKTAIGTAVDNIEGKISSLSSLSESAFWWGANMMGSYVNGIYSMSEYLRSALQQHAALVESYMGTYSNAEVGPLSHLEEWPRNLVRTYSKGLNAEMPALNTSFAAFAPGMSAGAGSAGGTRNVNLYVTQNITDRATADYAASQLGRVLQRHTVM